VRISFSFVPVPLENDASNTETEEVLRDECS
jgi:hypothetical protein